MKKVENIVTAAALFLFFAVMFGCGAIASVKTQTAEKEQIDLVKQDIIAEYGFEVVAWLDIEEAKIAPDREDFYIFTCIAYDDEDNLREYRFAVQLRIINGELEVATWQLKEAT